MIEQLTQEVLRPDQLLRITVVNNEEEIGSSQSSQDHPGTNNHDTPLQQSPDLVAQDLAILANSTPTTTAAWFSGDVNTAIGRTAHICYLDSAHVAEQLVASCRHLFLD